MNTLEKLKQTRDEYRLSLNEYDTNDIDIELQQAQSKVDEINTRRINLNNQKEVVMKSIKELDSTINTIEKYVEETEEPEGLEGE